MHDPQPEARQLMFTDSFAVRPDWVLLGFRWEDEFWLIASDVLTSGELETEVRNDFSGLGPLSARPSEVTFNLHVAFPRYVLVRADSYEQALRNLFDQWKPREPAQPAIAPQMQEIRP